MSYVSFTKPGIGRGPHEHIGQTDLFAFFGPGDFELQLWDNRKKSATYGNKMIINCGEKNPRAVIVPPRIVHGYKNISLDIDGMVLNYPDKLYKGKCKRDEIDEIRHEDSMDEFFQNFN